VLPVLGGTKYSTGSNSTGISVRYVVPMREITLRLQFTTHCLGNVKKFVPDKSLSGRRWPVYFMPRLPDGRIRFQANWWSSSLKYAARLMGKHLKDVNGVSFEVGVDGRTDTNVDHFYKRYFRSDGEESKFVKHEAFHPGDVIGVNCVVPGSIDQDDFWKLMDYVGRFKGISPFSPMDGFGRFEVLTVRPRENPTQDGSSDLQRR